MTKAIERALMASASVARVVSGIGPRIAFAPPNEGGAADDGGDKTGDDTGDDKGDGATGDADPGADKGAKPRDLGGLLNRRSKPEGAKSDDDGGDDKGDKTADDGRPEGLPDKFWDPKTKTVNAAGLTKAYADLEKAHGQLKRGKGLGGGEVPETAEGYFDGGLELPDTVDRLGLEPDDPGLKAAAKVFHKYGLGKEVAASIVKDMFVEMNEFAPTPIDPEAEFKSLGKDAQGMIDGVFVWVDGGVTAGTFSEDDVAVVENLAKTANGMRFLAKMRNAATGEKGIPITPGGGARGMSQNEWHDEFKAAVKANDYKRQAELEEIGKTINGTEPSHGGRSGGVNL